MFSQMQTSDVGFKHRYVDVSVEIQSVDQNLSHSLELRAIVHYSQCVQSVHQGERIPVQSQRHTIPWSEPFSKHELELLVYFAAIGVEASPAPGVLSITSDWAQFVKWVRMFQVPIVGMIKHVLHTKSARGTRKVGHWVHVCEKERMSALISRNEPVASELKTCRHGNTADVAPCYSCRSLSHITEKQM